MSKIQTIGADLIVNYQKQLGLSNTELAKALGVSINTPAGWFRKGEAPKYAAVACEGLVRRTKQEGAALDTFIIQVPKDQTKTVKAILRTLDCRAAELEYRNGIINHE